MTPNESKPDPTNKVVPIEITDDDGNKFYARPQIHYHRTLGRTAWWTGYRSDKLKEKALTGIGLLCIGAALVGIIYAFYPGGDKIIQQRAEAYNPLAQPGIPKALHDKTADELDAMPEDEIFNSMTDSEKSSIGNTPKSAAKNVRKSKRMINKAIPKAATGATERLLDELNDDEASIKEPGDAIALLNRELERTYGKQPSDLIRRMPTSLDGSDIPELEPLAAPASQSRNNNSGNSGAGAGGGSGQFQIPRVQSDNPVASNALP